MCTFDLQSTPNLKKCHTVNLTAGKSTCRDAAAQEAKYQAKKKEDAAGHDARQLETATTMLRTAKDKLRAVREEKKAKTATDKDVKKAEQLVLERMEVLEKYQKRVAGKK